ncbi:MAG: urate hydroxylase PuuD, partial [Bdellovibrionales bacterium]|nr:urate hydroxylase PuuD [Bdellovibrionales bacterium]
LLWFRMGALYTWLTGVFLLAAKGHLAGFGIYTTPWGINILIGALLGTYMFLNVWLIIWPNQKVVIQSANQVLAGGQPLPEAAACGAKAGLASRHNTLFSIPLLLFMGMASHFSYTITAASLWPMWIAIFVITGALECNAIKGKLGPMTSVRGVIHCGLALSAVLFIVVKLLT